MQKKTTMEFHELTLAASLVINMDIPSLYHFYNNKNLSINGFDIGIRSLLNSEDFIKILANKYHMVNILDFISFFDIWKEKYLFKECETLSFLFEHFTSLNLYKSLKQAGKYKILTRY